MFPTETEHFTLAQASEQSNLIEVFVRMPLHLAQKDSDLIFLQGVHLFSDDAWENARFGRVCTKIANQNSLLQRLVQHAVNVLDGLCGERSSIRF